MKLTNLDPDRPNVELNLKPHCDGVELGISISGSNWPATSIVVSIHDLRDALNELILQEY